MPTPKIKLPFGQIPSGTFDAAFKSKSTGLPMGVEDLAKRGVKHTGLPAGHEVPRASTVAPRQMGQVPQSLHASPPGPAQPNMPMPAAQPETMMPPTRPQGPAAPRLPISNLGTPITPPNSLSRGAPAGGASSLGTPITPPNSLSRGARPGSASSLGGPVKVGRSANDPMRIAETARRRGNIGPIMDMAKMQMQEDRADVRTERSEARADANFERSESRADARTELQRRDSMMNFERTQQAEDTRYQRGRADSAADSAAERMQRREDVLADEERRAKAARETYPILDPITGQKHEGHFMTGNGMMAPRKVPDVPLPAGFEPKSTNRDGTLYGPKDQVTVEPPKLPDGIQYEKDPSTGKITSGVYPKYDPQTGTWKLTRMDMNGDGVIDPAEKAAATAATTQEPGGDADWRKMPSGPARSYASVGLSPDGKPQPKTPALQSVIGRFKK